MQDRTPTMRPASLSYITVLWHSRACTCEGSSKSSVPAEPTKCVICHPVAQKRRNTGCADRSRTRKVGISIRCVAFPPLRDEFGNGADGWISNHRRAELHSAALPLSYIGTYFG